MTENKPDIDKEIKLKELEIKVLEIKLKEAELKKGEGVLKKLLNPFFASVLVAVIGGVISILSIKSEAKAQIELEKIKHEHSLYKEAFAKPNVEEAQRLISFYVGIGQLRANGDIDLGDFGDEEGPKTQGETSKDTLSKPESPSTQNKFKKMLQIPIEQTSVTPGNKLETALNHEKLAFENLKANRLEDAMKHFNQAEKIYPTLHSNHEILQLMKKNPDAETVKDSIRKYPRYHWAMSQDELKEL